MPGRNTGQHAPPPARLAYRPLWHPCYARIPPPDTAST